MDKHEQIAVDLAEQWRAMCLSYLDCAEGRQIVELKAAFCAALAMELVATLACGVPPGTDLRKAAMEVFDATVRSNIDELREIAPQADLESFMRN